MLANCDVLLKIRVTQMHYLSIDLEACNRYIRGSVFSIGVVEADEDFNIIYKEDIIINPCCRFSTKFRKPIEFSVSQEDAYAAPTLAEQYAKIKKLFTGDKLVMAHSANNDMFMLNEACKRARVPALKFQYICTQMIYSAIYDEMNGIGLDRAAEEMQLTFKHHKADDDAEMALYLLKSCLEHTGLTYKELEKQYGITRGKNAGYSFIPMRCAKLDRLRALHRQEKKQEQRQLQQEMNGSHNVAIELDAKTYDMVRGGATTIVTVGSPLIDHLAPGDTAYLVKSTGKPSVTKIVIESVTKSESFLDLYLAYDKESVVVHGDNELDFLDRMYQISHADQEKENGVAVITFHVLHADAPKAE